MRSARDPSLRLKNGCVQDDAVEGSPTQTSQILPTPNSAYIHVNEIRVGVIPDSTRVEGQREIAELCGAGSGHANIDGHGLHVETVLGNAMTMAPQICVAPGSAVPANHVNLRSRATRSLHQRVEKVEQPRVIVAYFAGAVIP